VRLWLRRKTAIFNHEKHEIHEKKQDKPVNPQTPGLQAPNPYYGLFGVFALWYVFSITCRNMLKALPFPPKPGTTKNG
jgi:hypothetical protein